MAMASAPFVGVVVDSGLHLGHPRLLVVHMGVRLPAGVQLVALPGAGALAVTGDFPSRARRSVRATAAGNGASSGFFSSAASSISSVALAAGRLPHGGIVVAATAGYGGGIDDDDDVTPEIDEEERLMKEKEQWMKDCEKYIVGWDPEKAQGQTGNNYQEWLMLGSDGEGGGAGYDDYHVHKEACFTSYKGLYIIHKMRQICKEKSLVEFIGRELICGASLVEDCMTARPPSAENYEALATIGKELKVAAGECQRGFLQSKSLDRALVAIKRLRASSLRALEDALDRLDIRMPLPQRPLREFAIDANVQATSYFILMAAYTHHVMAALMMDLYQRPVTGPYDQYE